MSFNVSGIARQSPRRTGLSRARLRLSERTIRQISPHVRGWHFSDLRDVFWPEIFHMSLALRALIVVAALAGLELSPASAAKIPSVEMIEDALKAWKERNVLKKGVRTAPKAVSSIAETDQRAANELIDLLKGEFHVLKPELEASGHILNRESFIGKHVTSLDSQLIETRPAIADELEKLKEPISQQDIINILQTELLKTKETNPAVKFEVLSGKLTIKSGIDKRWEGVSLGDINVYNVTAIVGGSIATCYALNHDQYPGSLGTMMTNCVRGGFLVLKANIAKAMMENVSANQMRAILEERSLETD